MQILFQYLSAAQLLGCNTRSDTVRNVCRQYNVMTVSLVNRTARGSVNGIETSTAWRLRRHLPSAIWVRSSPTSGRSGSVFATFARSWIPVLPLALGQADRKHASMVHSAIQDHQSRSSSANRFRDQIHFEMLWGRRVKAWHPSAAETRRELPTHVVYKRPEQEVLHRVRPGHHFGDGG
jgi:hypothetical protein